MSMNIRFNWLFKLASISMFGFVTIGAAYGHKGKIDEQGLPYFNKAQLYHVTNNLGMFCASLIPTMSLGLKLSIAGFLVGNLIFVIPLYYMAINGRNPYISKTMPIGGFGMLLGWGSLIFA